LTKKLTQTIFISINSGLDHPQPEQDRATLQQLSKIGFLTSIPIHMPNKTKTFWDSFRRALDDNKQNCDGKRRVLSIIADEFTYSELETNLNVSTIIENY